jgi:hypothetical protein
VSGVLESNSRISGTVSGWGMRMSRWTILIDLITVTSLVLLSLNGNAAGRELILSPKPATSPGETHAALALLSVSSSGDVTLYGRVKTVRQLRTGSPPNPWECAWIVWNYRDNEHFYYLALKPNGWELGKRDPAYRGEQRFLATGPLAIPLGRWSSFQVIQINNLIHIKIEDKSVVYVSDDEMPVYKSGKVGIYTEDAQIAVGQFRLAASPPDRDAEHDQHVCIEGGVIGRWKFPFLGYGCASLITRLG